MNKLTFLAVCMLLAFGLPSRGQNPAAPNFDLPAWDSTDRVRLGDFAGQIVVLDFFAYWCAPCRRASTDLEHGIAQYYAAKKGNPNGVPVRVLAINIERANPKQTAQFIASVGAGFVATDAEGKLLEKLGGASTPFIVIIDGTRGTEEEPEFVVVYKRAGFEGTKKLRQAIDSVKPARVDAKKQAGLDAERATGPPIVHKGGIAFEALLSSDIDLTTSALNYGQQKGGTEWNLSYVHSTFGEDYEPYPEFDFLGYPERLAETYDAGQAGLKQMLGERLALSAGGGVYSGFTDYRSLWLANYYKQQFDFIPGYAKPDPQGFNATTGLRWEYQPTTGFAEAAFLYARDEIAPGYEFEPQAGEAVHGREVLHTYAPALRFENVLTTRVRLLNELQLTSTSGREERLTYRGSVNIALGENWVWRTTGGYARENPVLRAWHIGSTLEFEFVPRWFVSAAGLHYKDTGEIENSLFVSTAAPGVTTWQGALGLRYAGEHHSFHFAAASVRSEYEPVEVGTRPFANLYRDRDWVSLRAAWALEF